MLHKTNFLIHGLPLEGLLDNLTEDELSKHAVAIAKRDFVDIGLLRGEFTLPSFLNILEIWSNVFYSL
jgi:hypothetical protein